MINLYTWSTPNGQKASIMLEELAMPYCVTAVNIGKGEQHDPEFRRLSPNGKIPVITDQDEKDQAGGPLRVFESGNILIYLAVTALKPLRGWLQEVGDRPAVKRGMKIPSDEQKSQSDEAETREGPAGGGTVLP